VGFNVRLANNTLHGTVLAEAGMGKLPYEESEWYERDISASTDYKYAKNRLLYGYKTLSVKAEDSIWSKVRVTGQIPS